MVLKLKFNSMLIGLLFLVVCLAQPDQPDPNDSQIAHLANSDCQNPYFPEPKWSPWAIYPQIIRTLYGCISVNTPMQCMRLNQFSQWTSFECSECPVINVRNRRLEMIPKSISRDYCYYRILHCCRPQAIKPDPFIRDGQI